jgi:hypothetical protein
MYSLDIAGRDDTECPFKPLRGRPLERDAPCSSATPATNDVLFGGPGADRIDCWPGHDTIEGVDRFDHVATNCEHVRH